MFIDGTELDRYFETAEGTIWISGLIEIRNGNLLLRRLLVYPTTGAKLPVGTPSMLEIVRSLKDEAIAQGLSAYSVDAERVYAHKRERIIAISGRLR